MEILLISNSDKINNAILGIEGNNYEIIDDISKIDYKIDYKYDCVIINDNGIKKEDLKDIHIRILFLSNDINYKEMRDYLVMHGGFAVKKPTSLRLITEILKLIEFVIHKSYIDKSYYRSLYAKYFLIKYKLYSETKAHKFIIDRAMTLRKPKEYVVEEIIKFYEGVENND